MSTNANESTLVLAREINANVASEYDALLPLATLASIASTHVLNVEFVREGEITRGRMRCTCGRSSYFANVASTTNVDDSSPLVVALRRHVRRVEGRAMRIVRANPRLLASLTSEGASDASEESATPPRDVVSESDASEGEEFARVRGGGASVHLTRDALTTLCARDASDMHEVSDDDEHATCRTCEARANASE